MNSHIEFPKSLTNSYENIYFLNKLLKNERNEFILYNMKDIDFFEASLIPLFHTINLQSAKEHKLFYDKLSPKVENFFIKNYYAKVFNRKKYKNVKYDDIYKNYIEFVILNNKDDSGFYIIKKKLKEKNLIDSESLLINILNNIGELVNNSYDHGKTDLAYFCGQYYPKLHKMSFAVSNIGVTINENVKQCHTQFSNEKCLEWIFEKGTSTRNSKSFGGLGLYDLKESIKKLNGNITIISGEDYYYTDFSNKKEYKKLPNKYKGTTVIVDIFYERGNYENNC